MVLANPIYTSWNLVQNTKYSEHKLSEQKEIKLQNTKCVVSTSRWSK